jgi:hypothetical protein
MKTTTLAMLAAMVVTPLTVGAQVQKGPTTTREVKGRIAAIDHQKRVVSLQDEAGDYETIAVGPDAKRFDELKVGDAVTFRTIEAVAYRIRKPGDPQPPPGSDTPKVTPAGGARPGGTAATQETIVVTVKAIDVKNASVTFLDSAGHSRHLRVDDPKRLAALTVGDEVEITYTEAVLVSVK